MRKNRRRASRPARAVARVCARVSVVLLAMAASATAVTHASGWAKAHPYFALREIDVEGRGALDANTLLAWAGLSPGMSAWSVDEREAERRLLAHPRVREAMVERTLPGRVRVHVAERQPVAIVLAAEPTLLASDGTVFPAVDGESLDGLPYVSGIGVRSPISPADAERLRAAARLVLRWREHEQWPALSEVRCEGDGLVVFAAGMPLSVRFGAEARADDLARLSTVLELWRGREAQVAAIDLTLPGEAVLKVRRLGKATKRLARRAVTHNPVNPIVLGKNV
ncbi:MAG TPA: FtsQ-type POTRA domain-containing protein [Candidatus Binatia bacterium]|nr:FtsQ-type POTRA domain-containing protein [Candidatus Binatia bacterium]